MNRALTHLALYSVGANPAILVRVATNEETNEGNDGNEYNLKRPKAGGIAFPFSTKGHQTSASMTTLTSDFGVPPAHDVRTDGVLKSGVSVNSADEHATNATGTSSEAAKVQRENERGVEENAKENEQPVNGTGDIGQGKEKAVENEKVVSADWPPIDPLVTPRKSF